MVSASNIKSALSANLAANVIKLQEKASAAVKLKAQTKPFEVQSSSSKHPIDKHSTNKPSILFINRVYDPSRDMSARALSDVTRGFAKVGWDVHVVTTGPKAGKQTKGAVTIYSVKGRAQSKRLRSYFMIWLRLFLKGLFAPRTSIVVTLSDPPLLAVAGSLIARIKGIPHVHWCQDLYPDLLPVTGVKLSRAMVGFFHIFGYGAMRKAARVVVPGRCMRQKILNRGIVETPISVIPHWPELEVSRKERIEAETKILANVAAGKGLMGSLRIANTDQIVDKTEVAEEATAKTSEEDLPSLNKDKNKFRVLYAGNISLMHPMRSILRAAEKLNAYPEIEFLFVGDSKGHEILAAERDRLGLQNIRMLPYQPAKKFRDVLESGDVHLVSMCQEAEGLLVPSKFYASLAVGRPCIFIGSQRSEIAYVLREFKAGQVIPQGEGDMLAQMILNYRMKGYLWFEAQKGAARAGDRFSPRRALRAWVSLMQDLLPEEEKESLKASQTKPVAITKQLPRETSQTVLKKLKKAAQEAA